MNAESSAELDAQDATRAARYAKDEFGRPVTVHCVKCGAAEDNHWPGGSRFGVCNFASPDLEAKLHAIQELVPQLLVDDARLRAAGFKPTAVVLPPELNPGEYQGPDATDHPATVLGLPVIWGKPVGLVI